MATDRSRAAWILLAASVWPLAAQPGAEYNRLLAEAGAQIRRNEPDAAIHALTRAVALDPAAPAGHLMLGQAYLAKASPEYVAQAKAEFQQARQLDANQTLASFYIAKIDLDLGRLRQAEQGLRAALEQKPNEHYLLALLAETRRRQGHAEQAAALATKAIAAGPEALPVHYYRALARRDLADDDGALADLSILLATPYATADAYLAAGEIHLKADRAAQAESAFRKALAFDANRSEVRLRLAQALRRLGKPGAALAELKAVEAAPQLSSPYFQNLLAAAAAERGLILAARGDAAGARAAFQRALELDPSNVDAARALK
jgi:predicted Zn-dependent protease